MNYLPDTILKQVYKKRNPWSHKGQFGRLLIIGGSKRYAGMTFTGLAAYRAGCDLVYLVGPQRAMDIAASYSPNLMTEPLEGDYLEPKHVKSIMEMVEEIKATAVVIGPGLWRTQQTRKAIVELISRIQLPMVVDADAIRMISAAKGKLYKKNAILTPHANEFFELSSVKVSDNINERIKAVNDLAHEINCSGGVCPLVPPVNILLKGHVDVISNGVKTMLNKTGSPYLTKGGTGDSLAGICGALVARGIDPFTAACAGAYINGKAGELAAKKYGEGLITTDLIEEIPSVIKYE
ncbi:NAD(P)H-hydrate dehydratase [archaeon]|nr:MAG: NAD(P)H-hydrate dehydratase [archaeon]